jgi:hypothetical protein
LRQNKFRLAEVFLSRCWRIKNRIGSSQLELARTLNMVAEVFYHQQRFQEAENMCRRVLEVYEISYGKDHQSTKVAADNLHLLEKVTRDHAQKSAAAAGSEQKPALQTPPLQAEKPATTVSSETPAIMRMPRSHEETGKMSAIPAHLLAPQNRSPAAQPTEKPRTKSIFTDSGSSIKAVGQPGQQANPVQANIARQETSQTNPAVRTAPPTNPALPPPLGLGTPRANIAQQEHSPTTAAVPAPRHQETGKIMPGQITPQSAGMQVAPNSVPRPPMPAQQNMTPPPQQSGTIRPGQMPLPPQQPAVRLPQSTPPSQPAARPPAPPQNQGNSGPFPPVQPQRPAASAQSGFMNLPLAKPAEGSSTALPPVQPTAPNPAPIAPTRGAAKKLDSSRPKCDVCGYDLDGEYCQRCTGTGLRPIRPDERLGGYF